MPDTQNHPVPLWIQSLLGVAVACREEVCIIVYSVSLFSTVCCKHSSTAASSSLQSFPNSFSGIGGLEGIQVLNRGKVFEVPKSFAAISNNQKKTQKRIKKKENKRETSSGGHRVWTEERSMVYIAQCNCHMKVKLCSFFFLQKLADDTTRPLGFITNRTVKKFNTAPVNDWDPS